MSQSSDFWNRMADGYAQKKVPNEAAYQWKLQATQQYLQPDMDVFEFGCGTGSTALNHAPHVKHIQAIDASSRMIEIAKSKAEAAHVDNVTFEHAAIEYFDAPDETYDVVLGLSILHLLKDKESAIAKAHRLLKPSGVFISSTPCIGETINLFKLIAPIGYLVGLLPLIRILSANAVQDSLTNGGFSVEHCSHPGNRKVAFIVARKV